MHPVLFFNRYYRADKNIIEKSLDSYYNGCMRQKILVVTAAVFMVFIFTRALNAQFSKDDKEAEYLKTHYSKAEYRVPMRDGVTLFMAVYSPRDTSISYPVLLRRTPYSTGAYGKDNYVEYRLKAWHHLAKEKFIIAFQDVRGRFMSEGTFLNMRPHINDKHNKTDIDESTDTYDTVDWMVKNLPNNNGKVGIWGISYPGFYAAMAGIDSHPALKAISPQAPISDWFVGDDFHHNGAFSLNVAFRFFSAFGAPRKGLETTWPKGVQIPTPDGYDFFLRLGPLTNVNKHYFHGDIPFWNSLMEHGTYDDFWQSRNSRPHLKNVKPAVMTVGGFFDAENAFGALQTYRAFEKNSPGAFNIVVLGPWFHGGWVRSDGSNLGDVNFGVKTGEYYVETIELPFFKYHLKGQGKLELPEASVFETGRNQWHTYDQWPPKRVKERKIYLQAGGKVTFESPVNERPTADTFVSDPAKPVPFTAQITHDMPRSYMVEDQRFAASRPDVMVYASEPLSHEVTIAGPMIADLYVSTSGTDSDWVVKLIDVYPDQLSPSEAQEVPLGGYQMMLRGEIMRGKFRNSYETPEAMTPNKITHIRIGLNDLHHTFRKGHKIMVQIQCSWFPLFDRNPQIFTDIYNAREKDFFKATQRVYYSKEYPGGIIMGVLDKE